MSDFVNSVIEKDQRQGHIINQYKFKVLKLQDASETGKEKEATKETKQESSSSRVDLADSMEMMQQPPPAQSHPMNEDMLKKLDEMSTNLIKLQMQLEQQENSFNKELQRSKQESYEKGKQEAKIAFEQDAKLKYDEKLDLLSRSITQLDGVAQEYKKTIQTLQNELVRAAVDVAKEVILVELKENSNAVALKLAKTLMEDLKEASNIKMKVNPKNFKYIKEKLEDLIDVHVSEDSAVNEGGVVLLSDIGNIEGNIMKRYETLKKAALSE